MNCDICRGSQGSDDSCGGHPVDPKWALVDTRCYDCDVAPGGVHHSGCDIERCSVCGLQVLAGCQHVTVLEAIEAGRKPKTDVDPHDPKLSRWTGEYPGVRTCRERGWYAVYMLDKTPVPFNTPGARPHTRCEPGTPHCYEDINRFAQWGLLELTP